MCINKKSVIKHFFKRLKTLMSFSYKQPLYMIDKIVASRKEEADAKKEIRYHIM